MHRQDSSCGRTRTPGRQDARTHQDAPGRRVLAGAYVQDAGVLVVLGGSRPRARPVEVDEVLREDEVVHVRHAALVRAGNDNQAAALLRDGLERGPRCADIP